ncbi:MAG: hypothetical protein IJU96_05135 [Clostridia bacterium]|nr:hypothetical protein [Clostridia bacterium]
MALFGKKEKAPVWIRKTHLLQSDEYICSACGGKAKTAHKTCPRCGAKPTKVVADSGWVDEAAWFDLTD